MLLRWQNFLEQFNFSVKYRKGVENPADMLSRPFETALEATAEESGLKVTDSDAAPDDEPPDLSSLEEGLSALEDDYLADHLSAISLDKLKQATAADPLFKAVQLKLESFTQKFVISDDLLFWTKGSHTSLFIPEASSAIRKAIFRQHHGHLTAGHFGAKRTAAKMLQRYFWPGLHRDRLSLRSPSE
mmetsp:Transcript_30684/g.76317  ORF Transcript_30684/g.76317 Transcript_30684/m.76317 type:complete len:187 (-) Transcript_30684:133-693(-)